MHNASRVCQSLEAHNECTCCAFPSACLPSRAHAAPRDALRHRDGRRSPGAPPHCSATGCDHRCNRERVRTASLPASFTRLSVAAVKLLNNIRGKGLVHIGRRGNRVPTSCAQTIGPRLAQMCQQLQPGRELGGANRALARCGRKLPLRRPAPVPDPRMAAKLTRRRGRVVAMWAREGPRMLHIAYALAIKDGGCEVEHVHVAPPPLARGRDIVDPCVNAIVRATKVSATRHQLA